MKSVNAGRVLIGLAASLAALVLAACGGGGGGSSSTGGGGGGGQTITQQIQGCEQGLGTTNPGAYINQMPVLIDNGPCAYFQASGQSQDQVQQVGSLNQPFTTVTVCVPGAAQGSSSCQTFDHVLVDTGSFGLRLVSDPNNTTTSNFLASLPGVTVNGTQAYECTPFASGVSWGSVRSADVYVGGEKSTTLAPVGGISIQVIGDGGSPPSSCTAQGAGGAQDKVDTLYANGVLGVGLFLSDCGTTCVTSNSNNFYYSCATSPCSPMGVPVAQQVSNPASFFGKDNNGVILAINGLPSGTYGATTLSGTLTFGINTETAGATTAANQTTASMNAYQADGCGNFVTFITSVGSTTISNSDPINATAGTNCNGTSVPTANLSFIDSGSNGVFLPVPSSGTATATIPVTNIPASCSSCGWYTPSNAPLAIGTALINYGGTPVPITFELQNASYLYSLNNNNDSLLAGLGAPSSSVSNVAGTDWGMPFFIGKSVYVAFEAIAPAGAQNTITFPTAPVSNYNGPFWAF